MLRNNRSQIYFLPFLVTATFYLLFIAYIKLPIIVLLKPLPIICLMMSVYQAGLNNRLKKWLITALAFSACGDILLTLPLNFQLEAGLASFLAAHIIYIIALWEGTKGRWFQHKKQIILPLAIILYSIFMLTVLFPFLNDMSIAVIFYIAVISFMAMTAIQNNNLSAFGAVLFMISDTLVAFEAFVFNHSHYAFWVMITYYSAQYFIIRGLLAKCTE